MIVCVLLYTLSVQADAWDIDSEGSYVSLSKNAEITHGNKIYYNFDKQNGCKINVFFFLYTMEDNSEPLSEIFAEQQINIDFGGMQIPALLNYSKNFGFGEIAGIYVAREVPLSDGFISQTENMLQDNQMIMKVVGDHAKYFDIPQEIWDFTDIKNHLNQAHSVCVAELI